MTIKAFHLLCLFILLTLASSHCLIHMKKFWLLAFMSLPSCSLYLFFWLPCFSFN